MSLFMNEADAAGTSSRLRRLPWLAIGFVYLVIWPLGDLVRHGHSAAQITIGVLALLSFIGLMVALMASNNPWEAETGRRTWILLGVTTVVAICYPLVLGVNWAGLPIYLGVAYAMTLPPSWAARGVLVAAALSLALCLTLRTPSATTALLTFETATIGLLMLAFRGSRLLIVQLQEARGEVARLAAGEERLRIARDLHDLLGHTLSLIVLKSEVAARLADRDPGRSLGEIKDIESVARQALADVREAVSGYRRRSLTDELDNARGVLAAAGVDLTVTTSGSPLPDQLDGLFGWAVREGVTNIVRHARARRATIAVARRDTGAVLEISDDGVGATTDGAGSGLAGLGERVTAAGGSLAAGPGPHGGFRLVVQAPSTEPAGDVAAAEPTGH
jgi:two-component system, NarL family, sensor histidine kinase DesK